MYKVDIYGKELLTKRTTFTLAQLFHKYPPYLQKNKNPYLQKRTNKKNSIIYAVAQSIYIYADYLHKRTKFQSTKKNKIPIFCKPRFIRTTYLPADLAATSSVRMNHIKVSTYVY